MTSLHNDLKDHLTTRMDRGFISHPLIHGFFDPQAIETYNRIYEQKTARIERALQERDATTLIAMYEKPYRLEGFLRARDAGLLDNSFDYWKLVARLWRGVENIYEQQDEWRAVWMSDRPNRQFCMSTEERRRLESLPNAFEIYRGHRLMEHQEGLSWTLSEDTALWFAGRARGDLGGGFLSEATVFKSDVLAHFDGEEEIVVLPDHLDHISTTFKSAPSRSGR